MKKWLGLLVLLCSWPLAWAQQETETLALLSASLDELMSQPVAIATQSPQPLTKAPAVVSVITAEDIRASGATNLVEALQGVPGVHVRYNQFGFRPLISLRGAAPKNTLILVNGAPMRDLVWATGIFWRGLPASLIERIEVIRGPGSALYGSDASAGVINVITRTAERIDGAEAGLRAASFDSQAAWLLQGAHWNDFDLGLTVEASRSDGHRPFIARDRAGNAGHAEYGYDNLDLRLSVAHGNWRLLADHMEKKDVGIGITGGSYLDPVTRAKDRFSSIAWLYGNRTLAPGWAMEAELRYRDLEYSSGNGFWEVPATLLSQIRAAEQRINGEASLIHTGWRDHVVRFGGGYVWQDLYFVERIDNGVPTPYAPEKGRHNTYLFAQDVWQATDQLQLTAGARYDRYSDVGGTFNPRLALVWEASRRWTVKLMAGRAFRAPSFLELYTLTGATTPNPDLKPEKSTTLEAAVSWRATRDLNLSASLFGYRQDNPIVDAGGTFRNVDSHHIRGLELEAVWQPAYNLRLAGNLALRDPDDEQYTRLRVPDHFAVPRRSAHLRAEWAFRPKWHWNLQLNWTGPRTQASDDPRSPLGAQTVVDTTLRYYHGSQWEFAASIRNLLDEDAREYTGTRIPAYLPLPRRNLYVEARFKF